MRQKARLAFLAAGVAVALAGGLGGCDDHPMEKAGRKLDRAGEKIEDAAKDVRDDLK